LTVAVPLDHDLRAGFSDSYVDPIFTDLAESKSQQITPTKMAHGWRAH